MEEANKKTESRTTQPVSPDSSTPVKKQQHYACDLCGETFVYKGSLAKHRIKHTMKKSLDRPLTGPRALCPYCPFFCKFRLPRHLSAHINLWHPDKSSLTVTKETTPDTVVEETGAITEQLMETQTTIDTDVEETGAITEQLMETQTTIDTVVEKTDWKQTAAEIYYRSLVPIFPGQEIKFQGDAGGNSSSKLVGGIKEEEMQIGEHDGSYSSEAVLTVPSSSSSSNSALEEFDRLPQEYKDMFQDIV